jgi:hypothetical protein
MADSNLRSLERAFRASGSVEDEAAWLRARIQAGDLEQSKLGLAAYCGSEAARTLSPPDEAFSLGLLHQWGQLAGARAVLELCAWSHERIEREFQNADRDSSCHRAVIARTLDGLNHWALEPTEHNRRRLGKTTAGIDRVLTEAQFTPDKPLAGWLAQCLALAAKETLQLAATRLVESKLDDLYANALNSSLFLTTRCWPEFHAAAATNRRQGYEKEEEVVKRGLVPWALGYRDPVSERVEARQREAAGE